MSCLAICVRADGFQIFTAPENLATEARAEDQQDYVSYLVLWGDYDDMVWLMEE